MHTHVCTHACTHAHTQIFIGYILLKYIHIFISHFIVIHACEFIYSYMHVNICMHSAAKDIALNDTTETVEKILQL